ncbi:MAG: 4-(cytidine 5'-diphospho)-2-C-methyl-D-erythritol kinase, partial [Thalassobaculaceae bacterium]
MTPTGLTELAPAKVNLTLRVTGRRDDGYHLLDSVVVFTDFGDRLSLTPHDLASDHLTLGGPFAAALAEAPAADNLVLRALDGFRRRLAPVPPTRAHLTKNLPVAAGIGGGSSDAAACLRLLARRAGIALADSRLAALAADLGADVPVCLRGRSARVTGIGDGVEDLPKWPRL